MRMGIIELLNFVFADILDGLDSKQRVRILAALYGRLGANGGLIVDDPDLPASMQGLEMPDWYAEAADPTVPMSSGVIPTDID